MPRPKNPVPKYRRHKPSNQAVVTVPLPGGGRRDIYLGEYGSDRSRAEYERVLAQLRASPGGLPATKTPAAAAPADLTVNELLVRFLAHADGYYRRADGTPTSEPGNFRHSLRHLRRLYGHSPAAAFGPLALKAVRQAMVDAGLCRTLVNKSVGRVRRVFRWAASEELVPFAAYHPLTAVAGLAAGRTSAREAEPVAPVAPEVVAATLPFLCRHVAAMARLQLLTGMRPGEVCRLTPGAVDRAAPARLGPVWLYRPASHKTAHRGKDRVVILGPNAQAVLAPFLDAAADPGAFAFSPAAARAERLAALRQRRKSKVPPSQQSRRVASPRRTPGAFYLPTSYAHAVAAAAEKAGVPRWHPNQLRHAFATEARRGHGLEASQVLLGHARADVTQVYAERDLAKAAAVALEIG